MKVLANPLDALNHVAGSRISLKCICPNCKNEIWTTPQNFKRFGLFCHNCQKRKMSFPEIFIYILLLEVLTKKEIENEKVFNWAYSLNNPKWHLRYDFYLTPLNCIIEVHGSHHYKALKSAKCLEEFKINDRRKQRLAFYNNISNYIVIDARYSQPCYLIRSILQNEKFIELFKSLNLDLSQQDDIFWNNINEKAKVFKSNQKR